MIKSAKNTTNGRDTLCSIAPTSTVVDSSANDFSNNLRLCDTWRLCVYNTHVKLKHKMIKILEQK